MELNHRCDVKIGKNYFYGQSFVDILKLLSSGDIDFSAVASIQDRKRYKPIMMYPDFSPFITKKLMLASNGYSHDSLFNHWYVKEENMSYGPFSLLQMLEFYYRKRVLLHHPVRHATFETWCEFNQAGPFMEESRKALLASEEIKEVVARRQQPRIRYENEVFLSGGGSLYRGIAWSLSTGGMGLVTDEATDMNFDSQVNLIINSNNEHGSIQIKGRVVNIKKEVNYERIALEFATENELLNEYIGRRIPG